MPQLPGDQAHDGSLADVGLLAEALIYYDRVYFTVRNSNGYVELVKWFARHGCLRELSQLMREGTLVPYHYTFISGAMTEGVVQEGLVFAEVGGPRRDFRHAIHSPAMRAALGTGKEMERFVRAATTHAIDESKDGYTPALRNAESDFFGPRRCEVYLRSWLDHVYEIRGRRHPPIPEIRIQPVIRNRLGTAFVVEWTVPQDARAEMSGLGLELPSPASFLAEIGETTIHLASAARLKSDLFPAPSASAFAGDKLYEALSDRSPAERLVTDLESEVEFPDVRALVNSGQIDPTLVLELRARAGRFRTWLQTEGERDRNAIVAYHEEVARGTGISRFGRSMLRLFSVVGAPATGAVAGSILAGPWGSAAGGAAGAAIGESLQYVADLRAKLDAGWSPAMFGRWANNRIAEFIRERAASERRGG